MSDMLNIISENLRKLYTQEYFIYHLKYHYGDSFVCAKDLAIILCKIPEKGYILEVYLRNVIREKLKISWDHYRNLIDILIKRGLIISNNAAGSHYGPAYSLGIFKN